MEKQIL